MALQKFLLPFAASFVFFAEIPALAQTALWQPTNGPPGGFVSALARNAQGHLFVGTASGIFRTTDSGERWTWLNTRYNIRGASALAVNAQGDIFAATDIGIFRSNNNGATWAFLNGNLRDASFIGMAPNGHIFVGAYRSIDNGNTWTKTNLPAAFSFAMAINANGHLFVGSEGGVYRSLDEGLSWRFFDSSFRNEYVISLAVDSGGNVLAGTTNGVYFSNDNGESWQQTPLSNTRVLTLAVSQQDHYFAATEDFSDIDVTTHLLRSKDHGDSWVRCDTILPKQAVAALAFGANGQIFAGMKGRGVFQSTDNGESWAALNLNNSEAYSLAVDSQGQILAGTREGNGGLFHSDNNGESWKGLGLGDFNIRNLAINSRGHFFVAAQSSESSKQEQVGVYRSIDHGDTWTFAGPGNIGVGALAIDSEDRVFAALEGDYLIFRSTDNGLSWTESRLEGLSGIDIRTLAVLAEDHVFVGTEFGLWRSTTHGESWVELKTSLTHPDIRALAANSQGEIFFGTYGRGVYRSTDGGLHWERRSEGLTNGLIISLALNARDDIFAGTDGSFGPPGVAKVFRSTDKGESWAPISEGSGQQAITSLVCNAQGYLFGGTIHGGVFRSLVPTVSVHERREDTATSFALMPNLPNPFNPSTAIHFELPVAEEVTLAIYNTRGQKVRQLARGKFAHGGHQLIWDGTDDAGARVASGVYLCRIEASGYAATRKLALVR